VTVVACISMLLAAMLSWFLLQTRPVYLVDYAVYRPPERCGGAVVWGAGPPRSQVAVARES
jgi:hypothetical protein